MAEQGHVEALTKAVLGAAEGDRALDMLAIDPALLAQGGSVVTRAAFAMAMNVLLFHGLLERVPSGRNYVARASARAERVTFDHGALRTIRLPHGPTGSLPPGEDAFTRILLPLGYRMAGLYPLDRLRMTGRAYAHADAPEAIPQFFLSELHVDRLDIEAVAAAERVFGTSRDPLDDEARTVLDAFSAGQPVGLVTAAAALPVIVGAFGRQHEPPSIEDYALLLAHSNEAAWIATEGNAFNHATDRVADVPALADALKHEGFPMKEKLEISCTGRVRQTAFRADSIERDFAGGERRHVPGSFYEFISRDVDPATGRMDLAFDTGNATGIFAMTGSRA